MKEITNRIQIIPLKSCLIHEGIVQKWVDQIAANIKNDGFLKNPVIVTKKEGTHIVLDGMHRFAAIQQLEIPDILACEVDYFSKEVILEGFDMFTFKRIEADIFLETLFPKREGFEIIKMRRLGEAKQEVLEQNILLAVADKGGDVFALSRQDIDKENLLDVICEAVDRVDRLVSERFEKAIYVDNSLTLDNFPDSSAQSVILRPQFTKKEVLDRTLNKKPFPPKSTRHLIPERPLRVDLDLSLLRADIDLKAKNKLLQDHLKWCYENNRVRFYPESVFVFAD